MNAEVRPTEDIEKVEKALLKVVKPEEIEVEEVTRGFRVLRAKCSRVP